MPCDVLSFNIFMGLPKHVFTSDLYADLFHCCFSLFLHLMSSLIILHKFGGKNCPHFIYELSFYPAFIKNYIFLHMLFELSRLHFLMPACILLKFCRYCVWYNIVLLRVWIPDSLLQSFVLYCVDMLRYFVSFAYFVCTRIFTLLFFNQLKQTSDSDTVEGKLFNVCFGYNYVVVFKQQRTILVWSLCW